MATATGGSGDIWGRLVQPSGGTSSGLSNRASKKYQAIWKVALARHFPDPDDYDDHWELEDPNRCRIIARLYRRCIRGGGGCEYRRGRLLLCESIKKEAEAVIAEQAEENRKKALIEAEAKDNYRKAAAAASFKTVNEYMEKLL